MFYKGGIIMKPNTYLIIIFKEGDVIRARETKKYIEDNYDIKRISLDAEGFVHAKKKEPRITITLKSDVKKQIISDLKLNKNISWKNGYNA